MSKNNLPQQVINLIIQRPIIFYPSGWNDCVPGWIIEKIKQERLENFKNYPSVIKEEATDAEIAAYLFTACLVIPVDNETSELYIHIVCNLASEHFGMNKSEFAGLDYSPTLSPDAQRLYGRLKGDIFRSVKKRIDESIRYVVKTQKGEKPV
ncbi:MAG: hypothetical protein WC976_06440 [Caldisericia bacterium]